MNSIMPIVNLLWYNFDKLKRNEDGTIVYDERFKEITENLLNLENLDSALYRTYDEFFNCPRPQIIPEPFCIFRFYLSQAGYLPCRRFFHKQCKSIP